MANPKFKYFYNSKKWLLVREQVLINHNHLCEVCGNLAEEVHHKIPINKDNITDINVTLNPDNLQSLCKVCHNQAHKRFVRNKQKFDANGNLLPD